MVYVDVIVVQDSDAATTTTTILAEHGSKVAARCPNQPAACSAKGIVKANLSRSAAMVVLLLHS